MQVGPAQRIGQIKSALPSFGQLPKPRPHVGHDFGDFRLVGDGRVEARGVLFAGQLDLGLAIADFVPRCPVANLPPDRVTQLLA